MSINPKTPTVDQILNCPNLPTLPTVAVQLLELIRDPDVGINDIKQLVESDTGLAGRVLKTVNSSAFGLRQRCNNIKRALGYMGMNSIKSLVLGFSLVDWTKNFEGGSFDIDIYWKRVIYCAAGARLFALEAKSADPDDVFTGALFQDMGILAMLTTLGLTYATVAEQASEKHDKLPEAELDAIGITHAQAGAALGEKWRLPESIVECVRHHHTPEKAAAEHRELVRLVALGRLVAAALCEQDYISALNQLCELANKWYALDRPAVIRLINEASTEGQELSQLFDQNIGARPDINTLLAEAGEQLLEHQMAVARQVSDLELEKQSLERSSMTDALTGAWNRKKFDQSIRDAFEQSHESGSTIGVIFMDGDRFKAVNDTYGHPAGDRVIQTLAKRMNAVIKDQGTVCRYGGEEFVVLLENTTESRALQLAEQIRLAMCDQPFDLRGVDGAPDELPITVSIGLSVHTPQSDGATIEQIIHEADQGVYASKRYGRNLVTRYTQGLESEQEAARAANHPAPEPKGPPPSSPRSKSVHDAKSVLILEDDILAARLLDAMFRRTPAVETECLSQIGAIEQRVAELKRDGCSRPDLIIVDLGLPGVSGVEIVKQLRTAHGLADLPVIVLTGCNDTQSVRAARTAGATAVYAKQDVARHIARWTRDMLALTEHARAA